MQLMQGWILEKNWSINSAQIFVLFWVLQWIIKLGKLQKSPLRFVGMVVWPKLKGNDPHLLCGLKEINILAFLLISVT